MIDLVQLHAAGAEVAGAHGDAWLRQSAVRNHRPGILAQVRELRARLGRPVMPCDLTNSPPPAAVAQPPAPAATPDPTPTPTEAPMPTPHPQFHAFKAACEKRSLSMNKALSLVPIASSAVHRLRCGNALNDDQAARLQAWIDGGADHQPTDASKVETATVRKPRAVKVKPKLAAVPTLAVSDSDLAGMLRGAIVCIERGQRAHALNIVRLVQTLVEAA